MKSVDEPELTTDIEQVASDQLAARIAEEFAGHGLATLVTELLTTDGFICTRVASRARTVGSDDRGPDEGLWG